MMAGKREMTCAISERVQKIVGKELAVGQFHETGVYDGRNSLGSPDSHVAYILDGSPAVPESSAEVAA